MAPPGCVDTDSSARLRVSLRRTGLILLGDEPVNAPRPGERPGGPDATRPGADRSTGFGAVLRVAFSPAVAWAHHGEDQGPIHSARFVLVDRQGRIRGYFASDESEALQRLRQAIARLLQEG